MVACDTTCAGLRKRLNCYSLYTDVYTVYMRGYVVIYAVYTVYIEAVVVRKTRVGIKFDQRVALILASIRSISPAQTTNVGYSIVTLPALSQTSISASIIPCA